MEHELRLEENRQEHATRMHQMSLKSNEEIARINADSGKARDENTLRLIEVIMQRVQAFQKGSQ